MLCTHIYFVLVFFIRFFYIFHSFVLSFTRVLPSICVSYIYIYIAVPFYFVNVVIFYVDPSAGDKVDCVALSTSLSRIQS